MRLLLFNLATDVDDPVLGFTTSWIGALAKQVEVIHVITMRAGRVQVPGNVRVHSVGKEKGCSEFRRVLAFYRQLLRILRHDHIDACFSHMIPIFTILAAQFLVAVMVNIFIVFPAMGKNYDAAVISAGFGGISLGSTPTAMANMSAVTQRYGASHLAFVIVPLVCAFFIDLVNAILIPFFLTNF